MTGNSSSAAPAVAGGNRTSVLPTNDAIHEFKIFNIMITSLALCILTLTGIFCSISYHRRTRQWKWARVYERVVGSEAGTRTARSWCCGLFSLLRGSHMSKNDPGIYFIYGDPVAVEDGNSHLSTAVRTRSELRRKRAHSDHLKDSSDGIILDPSVFYMQL